MVPGPATRARIERQSLSAAARCVIVCRAMRVLVDVGHPGHVHFYRQAVAQLRAEGHEVVLSARDKDVTLELLRTFSLEHVCLSSAHGSLIREYLPRLLA